MPARSIPSASDEVLVHRLMAFSQPSSPRSVALTQLASDSSFHLLDVHSINRGLEPLLVSAHAGRTQDGDDQSPTRCGVDE